MAAQSTTAFGALLRQHRIFAGLTQEALAERAGLSVYGIQKLEAGTTHPYRDTAQRLALALELTSDLGEQFRASVEPVRRHASARRDPASSASHHNLPVAVTSFVGREQELADIPPRLQSARLLTLTGVGGSGKTRLAIELSRRLVEQYRDGVWLVELAQVTDPALVPQRVGSVMSVHESADRLMSRALADALRHSHLLLVLDNCEHLLDACAALLDLLLKECPTLNILATSREPIGIPGEVSYGVPSLAAPDPDLSSSVADVQRSLAARMFVDRAAAVQPDFALAAENARAIAQICRRLDGVALALELAAACLDVLTAEQLASRLDHRFRLLTGGNRAALPRQQTLRATIDWSYQLLSETQQRVFERLSVFASGWTLEAAESICGGDGVPAGDVVDAVRQLIRKSLVVRIDVRSGSPRFGLLETLREYAIEKLESRGIEAGSVGERHAAYYSTLVERLDPAAPTTLLSFSGGSEELIAPVYEVLEEIHDNVGVALRWWLDAGRATEALVLLRALGPLWIVRGVSVEGRRWIEAVLDLAASNAEMVPQALYAQALIFAGAATRTYGDFDSARCLLEASVALWRALGDRVGLAQALLNLAATLCLMTELDQATGVANEALAEARAGGNAFTISLALNVLGTVFRLQDKYDRAAVVFGESAALARTVDRPSDRAYVLAAALGALGRVVSKQGDDRQALALFREALTVTRGSWLVGNTLGHCLDWLATVIGAMGDPIRAATLFGAAEVVWQTDRVVRSPLDHLARERDIHAVQAQIDQQTFAEAVAHGRSMTTPAVVIGYSLGET